MAVRPRDFKSLASTNFATRAKQRMGILQWEIREVEKKMEAEAGIEPASTALQEARCRYISTRYRAVSRFLKENRVSSTFIIPPFSRFLSGAFCPGEALDIYPLDIHPALPHRDPWKPHLGRSEPRSRFR